MNPNHQACLFIQLQGLRGYYEAAFPPKRVGFLVVLITWVVDLLAMVCITKHHRRILRLPFDCNSSHWNITQVWISRAFCFLPSISVLPPIHYSWPWYPGFHLGSMPSLPVLASLHRHPLAIQFKLNSEANLLTQSTLLTRQGLWKLYAL